MNRIDHFVMSEQWCLLWPNCIQVALLRGLSDHCPMQLSVDEENWGPRPLKILKCWQDMSGYQQFVKEKWNALQIQGWDDFVLHMMLRLIKAAMKEWHLVHAKNILGKI
jgi:predicted acyl esterase